MSKSLPDTTLESILAKLGFSVRCMWQKRGAPEDGWSWLECIMVTGGPNDKPRDHEHAPIAMMIVQTFKGGGWSSYLANIENSIESAVREVMLAADADPMKHLAEIEAAIKAGTAFAATR